MRVLFIYWANPGNADTSTLTQDLAEEFQRQGHEVTIVIPLEKKFHQATHLLKTEHYEILYVKTGNFFNLNSKMEKIITTFFICKLLLRGIMTYLAGHKFDLIITRAPFLSDPSLIKPLKKYFKCPVHLLLFDIFPQTAWDMGIIKNSLVYKFFKYKEKKILSACSVIWCTSPGNAKYILNQYPELSSNRVEWMYDYAIIKPRPEIDRIKIRQSMGYNGSDFIALFGGNMGIPQKLENILFLAREALVLNNAKFLFIGGGTEKSRIIRMAKDMQLSNIRFIDYTSREKYEYLAAGCDIGLVSLDERFTIPNFPSKTIDYFAVCLPVLASLDKSAADDYGKLIQEQVQAGFFAISGDTAKLFMLFKKMYSEPVLCRTMGNNGRAFYEREFDVRQACKKIVFKFLHETQL